MNCMNYCRFQTSFDRSTDSPIQWSYWSNASQSLQSHWSRWKLTICCRSAVAVAVSHITRSGSARLSIITWVPIRSANHSSITSFVNTITRLSNRVVFCPKTTTRCSSSAQEWISSKIFSRTDCRQTTRDMVTGVASTPRSAFASVVNIATSQRSGLMADIILSLKCWATGLSVITIRYVLVFPKAICSYLMSYRQERVVSYGLESIDSSLQIGCQPFDCHLLRRWRESRFGSRPRDQRHLAQSRVITSIWNQWWTYREIVCLNTGCYR